MKKVLLILSLIVLASCNSNETTISTPQVSSNIKVDTIMPNIEFRGQSKIITLNNADKTKIIIKMYQTK